jgi:CheY-like chemotaxis protein
MDQRDVPDQQGTRPVNIETARLKTTELPPPAPDYPVPWVIELRVVGTPSVIQAQVSGALLLGRADPRNNIRPDVDLDLYGGLHRGVSRRHATIYQHQNRLMIRDLGSANGTALNDQLLPAGQGFRLRHGDTVSIGALKLQVFFAVMPTGDDADKTGARRPANFEIPRIGGGRHLLIIDEDASVAFVFRSVLEQAGFRTSVVSSFQEAVGVIDVDPPHMLISELLLPDMDAVELVRYVRDRAAGYTVPILIVTNSAGSVLRGQAIGAGADAVLSKPIGIDDLLRAVERLSDQAASQS